MISREGELVEKIVLTVAALVTFRIITDFGFFDWLFERKEEKTTGDEHIRTEPNDRKQWCFSDCGLYAAAIEREKEDYNVWLRLLFCTRAKMTLTIYDYNEGKAYDYINELWFNDVAYFYWFKGEIITIQAYRHSVVFNRLELDHEKRIAKIVQTRNRSVPMLRTPRSDTESSLSDSESEKEGDKNQKQRRKIRRLKKKERKRARKARRNARNTISLSGYYKKVYNIGYVTIGGVEYIPLFNDGCTRVVMFPRNPKSNVSLRVSLIRQSDYEGFYLFPIIHGQSAYFLNTGKLKEQDTRVLDSYLEVNLSKLKNVAGRFIDTQNVLLDQGGSATEEISLNNLAADTSREFHTTEVTHLTPVNNGQVSVCVQDSLSPEFTCYHIDFKKMQILPWKPKNENGFPRSNQMIYHPDDGFVEISYFELEDGLYRLVCQAVPEAKITNKTGYNTFVTSTLERKNMPIPLELLELARRVL